MAEEIDKNLSSLSIYNWSYNEVQLVELKRWVDTQIEMGMKTVRLDISWGHYHDIDALDITAEK